MISMQRSLSSPASKHSAPLSPSLTASTRSPSPSPRGHGEILRTARRPRSRSRSASRYTFADPFFDLRRDELPRRPPQPLSTEVLKKPIVAQPKLPPAPSKDAHKPASLPPPLETSSSDAAVSKGRRGSGPLPEPLLQDLSLYTNPRLGPDSDTTTLDELAHLARLSKFQESKRANTRIRLERSLVSTALSARLTRCGEIARRNLVDCFKLDDTKGFATLYNAIHDVRKSCDELRRYALLEPEMEPLQSPGLGSSESLDSPATFGSAGPVGAITPFLHEVSAISRHYFLDFLAQIRTNPDYLATRLASLTYTELNALATFHQFFEPTDSVLPQMNRPRKGPSSVSSHRSSLHVPNNIEKLLSLQRHDPLSALIHTCFANSAGPGSAEDRRRTDIWATACARLLSDNKPPNQNFVASVLNVWISMRDWSGKSSMELYLMRILEDGAFLLDRAEDQRGTRFNLSDWTNKEHIAVEQFYERAVNDLFEVLDDEDATGIPDGLVELGNEIIGLMDGAAADRVRQSFVPVFLFKGFLYGLITYPETHGMMAEYHIPEYGRQKILKNVFSRAQKLADMAAQKSGTVSPKISRHVENITARFAGSRSARPAPKLMPARSVTSLRETVEVRPYLVVSPADLVTLVNALHPERRPQSAQSSSFRSGALSISGMSGLSQPISAPLSRYNFETASVVSASESSVISEATTSREPLLEEQRTGASSQQRYSPPVQDAQARSGTYENDGIQLRMAMREMVQALGHDAVNGSCHPCAERWAVLFISPDGGALSTQMTYDPDEDGDEEENSSTSDTDDDEADEKPELDKDYHQLRDSILKLVEDYEIPQSFGSSGSEAQFSNRASGIKKYHRSKKGVITTEKSTHGRSRRRRRSRNIWDERQSSNESVVASSKASTSQHQPHVPARDGGEAQPVLIAMLAAASAQSRAQSDYVSAHLYWKTLQQLNTLESASLRQNGFATLLDIFSRGPRDSIRLSASAIEEYDAWLVWLKQSQERLEGQISYMMRRIRALRDKMWYVTDVRNSGPYDQSRNICVALKAMGMPRRSGSFARTRAQLARGPMANYLYRSEEQIMGLLAASDEQGGPNKLSDEQAENTDRWLRKYEIVNFCRGEERIHRFCFEVETCADKLVGETILESPVLWSSDLYARDRRILDGGGRTGRDRHYQGADDTSIILSDPERRFTPGSGRPSSLIRDLRAMSVQNSSQQSFDSRVSFSRPGTVPSEHGDSPDYFGVSSPVHTIDSTSTYWSPFHAAASTAGSTTSRAQSPTTSITNFSGSFTYSQHQPLPPLSHQATGRPGTSASSNETIFQQRLSEEKGRFQAELRHRLISLLLSDLGNLVYATGSETDAWFDSLGQECIDRREGLERKAQRTSLKVVGISTPNITTKLRIIEKKKSFNNLRGAGGDTSSADKASSEGTETPTGPGNESSATSDTVSGRPRPADKDSTPEFPFKKAYQRLLRTFSVHPNPYAKLNALYELRHLVIASLASMGSSRKARLGWARADAAPPADEQSGTGRPTALDDAIDTIRERRSNAFHLAGAAGPTITTPASLPPHALRSAGSIETRSIVSTSGGVLTANKEAVTAALVAMFRDAGVRPHTLFRDLQFVAAFVPSAVFDNTDRGQAFWDAALAALSVKQEVCRTMLEVADQVVEAHTGGKVQAQPQVGSQGQGNLALAAEPRPSLTGTPPPATTAYKLEDAARMLTILAKEGDAAAQRELGFFYLSRPEMVERTTLPLSRPRDVFNRRVMERVGGGRAGHHHHSTDRGGGAPLHPGAAGEGSAGEPGDVRKDLMLMCVAVHWMAAAQQGGDDIATRFLKQNELNRD